jgi:hypothetical protein
MINGFSRLETRVYIGDLPEGVYLIRITQSGITSCKKIVLMK